SRRQQLAAQQNDPVTAGLEGLLLLGAVMAAALAIIGSAAQTLSATAQRATQFAVLRTLGLGARDLGRILLSEQIVVYLFGLVGGTTLGAILATATLPYLQFSDPALNTAQIATANVAQVGIPPYTLAVNWAPVGLFFLALLVACGLALLLATRLAAARGLGQSLRIGED
ncbi:MAG TPA: FtsX-like permease family protein, partial [Ktedonobacterales bacterium]|nr:FtsX-like permease family protein [Ktedonobacterales bacterium]